MIPDSAVRISSEYAPFDARACFADVLAAVAPATESQCGCGDVLRGVIGPNQCPFFGSGCTPEEPLGPCMVSTEGACAAAYIYGGL